MKLFPRKLLPLFLFCLPAPVLALNMRLTGWCEQGGQFVTISPKTSTPAKFMRSFPGCTVTVYNTGTITLATLYSDTSNTPLANPFTADQNGMWFFYAGNGRYDIQLSGASISSPFTIGDVTFQALGSGGGGGGGGTPGGNPLQVQYNANGTFGGFTVTGDATLDVTTGILTLASVNSNIGICGDTTHYPIITLNAKGLATGCTPQAIAGGGTTTPGGSSGQLQYNNSGAFGGVTMTGDGSLNTTTGVLTVTATSGVAFAPSATINALNASNISSGTLPAGRMPAFSGDASSAAGTTLLTLATVNSNVGTCGDSTHVGQVTLTGTGLATACTPVLISGGGGGGGGSTAWSSFTNPSGALALTMAHFQTVWTYDTATGTSSMQLITDTASNTGTGPLWRSSTASGSTAVPWQADANGVGWQVNNSGQLVSVGASGVEFVVTGLSGTAPSTPAATTVSGYFDSGKLRWASKDANAVVSRYVPLMTGEVSVTGQVAAISTANLCTTANCGAGLYRVTAFLASTLVCASPGPGIAGITIGWTDDASAKTLKLPLVGTGLSTNDVTLGQTTAFGQLSFNLWSAGAAAITYATNYTACTTGTGTYSLRIAAERIL